MSWHGAGDDAGGCRNREDVLAFIRNALDNGPPPELLLVEPVGDVVVATLWAAASEEDPDPDPHGEICATVLSPK